MDSVGEAASLARNYEEQFAALVGVRRAVAFSFARTGLACVFRAAGLQRGDEVLLSPLTCKVVPLAIQALDLLPRYADIAAGALNLDAAAAERAVGASTRAILFQHTYGSSSGIEAISEMAARRKLLFIEDCAQCTPYSAGTPAPGQWGAAGVFSNNVRKPIPAGSGGLAVTNDARLAEQVVLHRDQLPRRSFLAEAGDRLETWAHEHVLRPRLYWPLYAANRKMKPNISSLTLAQEIAREVHSIALRISERQARAGLRWLAEIEAIVRHRRLCCEDYASGLRRIRAVEVPQLVPRQPLFYFPVLVRDKPGFLKRARKRHLEIIAWPLGTPMYPVERKEDLARYGYQPGSCPIAENVADRLVGLPTDFAATAAKRKAALELIRTHHESAAGI